MESENFKNMSIYDVLKQRDLIKQITFEEEFKEMVQNGANLYNRCTVSSPY